jgi:hypothetical protein
MNDGKGTVRRVRCWLEIINVRGGHLSKAASYVLEFSFNCGICGFLSRGISPRTRTAPGDSTHIVLIRDGKEAYWKNETRNEVVLLQRL